MNRTTMTSMGLVVLLVSAPCYSAGLENSFSAKPLLLDSQNSGGTALGLEYEVSGKLASQTKKKEGADDGESRITIGDVATVTNYSDFRARYVVSGIWTVDKTKNPKSFSKARIDGGYEIFKEQYDVALSLFYGMEGDQDYSNRQNVYGAEASGQYSFTDDQSTYVSFVFDYDQVDAEKDSNRSLVTNQNKYDRLSGEVQISYGLNSNDEKYRASSLQFNYRYYKELNPPSSVVNAGIDTHKLATYLVKFNKGFYVAYSAGNLPFDKQSDKIFEIGFSQNIF